MIKSYKVRLYPTREQEQKFWRHIGACRFVWNYMLATQQARYEAGEKHLPAFDMMKLLTPLKNDGEHGWLYEVSNATLQTECRDLAKAYEAFFKKRACHPKFKSRKRDKPTYPTRYDSLYFIDGRVNLEKIGKVRYKTDFDLPQGRGQKFTNPRVSFVNGKWMLSFGLECENQVFKLTDKSMGIDLGIKELAVVAYGDEQMVFHNINKSKRVRYLERELCRVQRGISRKYEANRQGAKYVKTRNIEREEEKARKIYARLRGIRQNYLHQTTHALVSKLPYRVVMEDLNVSGMMKNRHLAKAVAQQGFEEFVRQMQYKCQWRGIEFVQVGRFFPSSKTCSRCGVIKRDLKLSDRTFKCECGYEVDRDYNAALNLSRYAA